MGFTARVYRERNERRYRKYAERRQEEESNRDEILSYGTRYYQKNAARILAARAKQHRDHPEIRIAATANWRARKVGAPGGCVTPEQIREVLESTGGSCVYCGAVGKLTVDHVVPLSVGGAHEVKNLVPCCQSCNSSKGAKSLDEWKEGGGTPFIPRQRRAA